MKKITICFMATCLSFTFLPFQSHALSIGVTTEVPIANPSSNVAVDAAMARLCEIKAMDKSNLSSAEKRDLRKEVRSLKHELKKSGKGIYLSVGAAIIIVLLLILIL
jgi:hypothetical protein